jgi:hypothetical protein
MNKSGSSAVALLVAVWLAAPAFASAITSPEWDNQNGAAIYVLAGASAQALERARMNKGSRKSWCLMKNVELNNLIGRLEHGQRVTLKEIVDAVDGLLGQQTEYQPVALGGCD